MEARTPYLSPDLWSLFPDRLDDEGKPEGWELGTLSQLCEVTIGGLWGNDAAAPSDEVQFSCLRGVDLQSLRETGAAPKTPQRFAKSPAIERRTIQSSDVLIASSGAGPCGRSLWVGVEGFFGRTPITYSNFVKRLSCNSEATACFVDRVLFEMRQSGEMNQFITGTSVPNLNDRGLLDSHRIVIPDASLVRQFRDFMSLVQAHLYSGQSETLAQTRDLLLPRLMSGELRVADLDAVAKDTAA